MNLTFSLNSLSSSLPASSSSSKHLTDEDSTHILHFFIQHQDAYERDTDKIFFQKIVLLFMKTTDKKHQTLRQAVNVMIKT